MTRRRSICHVSAWREQVPPMPHFIIRMSDKLKLDTPSRPRVKNLTHACTCMPPRSSIPSALFLLPCPSFPCNSDSSFAHSLARSLTRCPCTLPYLPTCSFADSRLLSTPLEPKPCHTRYNIITLAESAISLLFLFFFGRVSRPPSALSMMFIFFFSFLCR